MKRYYLFVYLLLGFVEGYSQESVKSEPYIILCDSIQQAETVFIINEKYCFVSNQEKNILPLIDSNCIKGMSIFTILKKETFLQKIKQFNLEACKIHAIFCVQLKDDELPDKLKKYFINKE